jgi:prepilin-type N-terminal cleavage/methylation domain-containing protein
MPTLVTGIWGNKQRRKARAVSSGFTLVEIMVVVFIVGLLASAAVIVFGGERRDVRDVGRALDVRRETDAALCVGSAEVHVQRALGRDRHARGDDVDLAGLERRHEAVYVIGQ